MVRTVVEVVQSRLTPREDRSTLEDPGQRSRRSRSERTSAVRGSLTGGRGSGRAFPLAGRFCLWRFAYVLPAVRSGPAWSCLVLHDCRPARRRRACKFGPGRSGRAVTGEMNHSWH